MTISLSSCSNQTKENKVQPTQAVTNLTSPNIILFVSDDHGTDALGCYGNPIKETNDPWLILWDHDASLQGSGVNL